LELEIPRRSVHELGVDVHEVVVLHGAEAGR
jgi:hypothetical protein